MNRIYNSYNAKSYKSYKSLSPISLRDYQHAARFSKSEGEIELVSVSCYSFALEAPISYEHPSRDLETRIAAAAAKCGRGFRLLRTPGPGALREFSRRLAAHTRRPPQTRLQRIRVRPNRGRLRRRRLRNWRIDRGAAIGRARRLGAKTGRQLSGPVRPSGLRGAGGNGQRIAAAYSTVPRLAFGL